MPIAKQPISKVKWIAADEIHPNEYNPNHVPALELDLLATSIATDGWTQPIVINEQHEIIDGFHRWTIAQRPEIARLTAGKIPTVMITDRDALQVRASTIRHNRARGNHLVKPMAQIVSEMLDAGTTKSELRAGLGMDDEEIRRLSDHHQTIASQYADHQPTNLDAK